MSPVAKRLHEALSRMQGCTVQARPYTDQLDAKFIIEVGETPFYCEIQNHRLSAFTSTVPLLATTDLTFSAAAEAWADFWEAIPRPGAHDIFALQKEGRMKIAGDMHLLMSHLLFFKNFLAIPRERSND
jgi:hypothetical protein